MSKGGAESIGIGNHEGIFEASAEGSGPSFQGQAILEVLGGGKSRILTCDEFDDTHGFKGHFASMREYAWDEDRGSGPDAIEDLLGSIGNSRAVLIHLHPGIGDDGGGGGLGESVEGKIAASCTFSNEELRDESGNSREFGWSGRVNNSDVKPQEVVG